MLATTAPLDFSTRFHRSEGRSGRSFAASVELTKEELAEVELAARARRRQSANTRNVLLREATSARVDPLFTEVVAIRMLRNYLLKPFSCGEHNASPARGHECDVGREVRSTAPADREGEGGDRPRKSA
jgi:hypothetical protein